MAVRIRKLARELNRSAADIIGVLHALGLNRYRSADDMLPAPAEARLRTGIRTGVQPVPVEIIDADGADEGPGLSSAPRDDLMSRLVPGVARVDAPRPARAADPGRGTAPPSLRGEAPPARRGEVPPPPRAPGAPSAAPKVAPLDEAIVQVASGPEDMMSRLVPGVARAGAAPPARGPARTSPLPRVGFGAGVPAAGGAGHAGAGAPSDAWVTGRLGPSEARSAEPRPAAPEASRAEAPLVVDGEWRVLQAERAALDSHRRLLDSERAVFDAEREALADDRRRYEAQVRALGSERTALESLASALDLERRALEAERDALAAAQGRQRASELASLQDLLEERGLRGADELERGVATLAAGRQLREVLWTLRVESPDLMRRVLTERLLLVDQAAPESVARAAAVVTVAPDRAEVPSAAQLARMLTAWGEALLLRGVRRVTVVGGRPLWHRLLRDGLDGRIEARFVPGRGADGAPVARDGGVAASDVERTDLVIVWGVPILPTGRVIYNAARALLIELEDVSLTEMVAQVVSRLRA